MPHLLKMLSRRILIPTAVSSPTPLQTLKKYCAILPFALLVNVILFSPLFADNTRTRVAVVSKNIESPLVVRLSAELESLGLDPVPVERSPNPSPHTDLDEIAKQNNAAAAIRIVPSSRVVEVWVADRITGKTVIRKVAVEKDNKSSVSVVALRAVELLRASLLEIHDPHPSRGEVEPTPQIVEIVPEPSSKPPPERLALEAGPVITAGNFASPPMMHLIIGGHLRIIDILGVTLFGLVPLIPLRIEKSEGDAVIRFGLLGIGPRLMFGKLKNRVLPSVGVGATALFVHVIGEAKKGYKSNDDWVYGVAPYVRGGLSLRLTEVIRLRVDLLLGWAMPETVIQFDGREVATWGQVLLSGAIGIELFLF